MWGNHMQLLGTYYLARFSPIGLLKVKWSVSSNTPHIPTPELVTHLDELYILKQCVAKGCGNLYR